MLARKIRRPWELLPDAIAELVGRRPWTLLRLETLAFVLGDHETALRSARRGADRGEEQATFVSLASEWELGEEPAAIERARSLLSGEDSDQRRWRAVARFFQYLERPSDAMVALERLGPDTDAALITDLALLWSRHGEPARARALLDQVLAVEPENARAREHRELVEGEEQVLAWRWLGGGSPRAWTARKGRILYLVARSLPHHHAGSTYRTHYTVSAQRSLGLDAQVVTECGFPASTAGDEHPPRGREVLDGVPYHRLPATTANGRVDRRLREHLETAAPLVDSLQPAVLHPASTYQNAAVALGLRERFGIPVVHEVRGFPEEYLSRRPASRMLYEKFGTTRRIEAECWRRADRVVTLAEVMKGHIVGKGVDPDRVAVIPNAVDPDRFVPMARERRLAARLGLSDGEVVLGYVTNLQDAHEGIRYLIEAVARLTRAGRPVRALLIGDGVERNYLARLADRLKVGDRVIFTGRVDHAVLPAYYALIDIFVVPRPAEPAAELVTPLKPFEAMAMEKAVVVSATAALREVVGGGRFGLTFEPEDVDDLVRALERLIEDRELRTSLGRAARQWVSESRTWMQNAERYRELYAGLNAI